MVGFVIRWLGGPFLASRDLVLLFDRIFVAYWFLFVLFAVTAAWLFGSFACVASGNFCFLVVLSFLDFPDNRQLE